MASKGAGMQPKLTIRRAPQRAHPGQSSRGQKAIVVTIKTRTNWKSGTASSGTHKTD